MGIFARLDQIIGLQKPVGLVLATFLAPGVYRYASVVGCSQSVCLTNEAQCRH